jgi:hypothetical protein
MTLNEALRATFPGVFVHVIVSGSTLFVQHLIVPPVASSKTLLSTGSKVIRGICWYADANDLTMKINVKSTQMLDARFERAYPRFGFEAYEGLGPRGLIRQPRFLQPMAISQPPRGV